MSYVKSPAQTSSTVKVTSWTLSSLHTHFTQIALVILQVKFFNAHIAYVGYSLGLFRRRSSARNGNLEVPLYFLKAKQVCTVRRKEDKWM
jgi:hypothetical protein